MTKITPDIKVYFPLKLNPRDQQLDGLNFVKESINKGNRNILLNLPTGVGKSYFAIMFMNWYRNFVNSHANFDIITNSKILQKQYIKDTPNIKNWEGRANYQCDPLDSDCSKGFEICKVIGPHCGSECPYEIAKESWKRAEIGLTNFHLFNTVALYVKTIYQDRKSNVLIIDEAHDFESVFCDFISVDLCAKSLKKYGFDLKTVEEYDQKFSRIKTIDHFVGFLKNGFISEVEELKKMFDEKIKNSTPKQRQEYSKYSEHCSGQILKFKYLVDEYTKTPNNWVLDITKPKDKMYTVLLEAKPVWGHQYIKEQIFDKYDHIILMSGSILNRVMFSYINGLSPDETTYFEIPSPFPVKNRPIYYLKCGKMTMDQKEDSFKNQLVYIQKILNKYKDKKGIIHCGTYEFSEWLQENLFDKRLIFHTPDNREEMLAKHLSSDKPTVIVSPSMVSGVDLKDDLSRFQIIMKIPFPYLGSNKIKQRQKTNKEWYTWKTIVDLIQAYGRSIRSEDDHADTFILDSSLSDLLKYNGHLIPRWVTNSIREMKL